MKLHKLLFSLLIIFLPVQLGIHFWPDWSMVKGLRIDYLSPTLYFTDIIIFGILFFWLVEAPKNFSLRSKNNLIPLFFFIFLLINCLLANNQPAAFYKLFKLVEFGLLGVYIVKNKLSLSAIRYPLSAAIIYSSLLAIFQFINQGSLGGIFYWLGERSFNSGTPGIALANFNGQLLLRPYATFPHPNVLAGFLVISLLLITQLPITNYQLPKNPQFFKLSKYLQRLAIPLGLITLFLTFSHVAWVVFLLAIFFLRMLRRNNGFIIISLFVVLVFICSIGIYFFPIQSDSFSQRWDLNISALKMWQSSPLLGVGLNNFLVRLPEFYQKAGEVRLLQPAHNVFLLVLAETGIIGLISLIWLIVLTFRRLLPITNYKLLITFVAVLVLGLFDHYFYTLQQGQLLMVLILGLCWSDYVKISS